MATLVQVLAAFGNMIGRTCFFSVGATRHYLNLFVALVGLTALGRKGTSWDVVRWTMAEVDPEWSAHCIASGMSSGEGLIFHVRDPVWQEKTVKDSKTKAVTKELVCTDPGVTEKRLLVVETEMGRVLKVMNRDANTLSDVLRQAWDTGDLRNLSKQAHNRATGAHITVIVHVTQADVRKHLTETDSANGFANRFVWALSRRSKNLPDGGNMEAENWEPITAALMDAVQRVRGAVGSDWTMTVGNSPTTATRITRTPAAKKAWHAVYDELSSAKPGLVGKILSRAEAQVMRIACLYAVLDGELEVDAVHLFAALALWEYCDASARLVFGNGGADPDVEKLVEALKASPDGLTRSQINVDVFGKHKRCARAGHAAFRVAHRGCHSSHLEYQRNRSKSGTISIRERDQMRRQNVLRKNSKECVKSPRRHALKGDFLRTSQRVMRKNSNP